MHVYITLMAASAVLGILLCEWRPSKLKTIIFMSLLTAALVILFGIRARTVGIDYPDYSRFFSNLRLSGISALRKDNFEIGFGIFTYLVSRFTGNVQVYMTVCGLAIHGLAALYFYLRSDKPWVSMYIYITYGFYVNSYCFTRQAFAITILFFALDFIKKKKILPVLLLILLAASFHTAALIVLPAYFFCQLKLSKKMLIFYGGVVIFILLFSRPILNLVTRFIYQNYANSKWLDGRSVDTAFIPVVTMIAVLLFYELLMEQEPANLPIINFTFFGALLYILTIKHFIFQRFALYFFTLGAPLSIASIVRSLSPSSYEDLSVLLSIRTSHKNPSDSLQSSTKNQSSLQQSLDIQKRCYYIAIAAVLFFGAVYMIWFLSVDRILITNYLPYWKQP